MEFASVVEYLEDEVEDEVEVEVLPAANHWNDAFGGGVGARVCLGEWRCRIWGWSHDGKVVVQWVVSEGIHGGTNSNQGKIDDGDWREKWTKEEEGWIRVWSFKWNDLFTLI